MKLTLITVCRNSAAVIRTALESVLSQRGAEIEYIVVDGGSTDGTVEILKEYEEKFRYSTLNTHTSSLITFRYISERDDGMYDAMNKGIRMSTGDVIGILNADDVLAADDTLARVAAAFEANPDLDGTYADIRFVKDDSVRDQSAFVAAPKETGDDKSDRSQSACGESHLRLRTLSTLRYCTGRFFRPWMFRFGVQTAHPSTFFRRSCFDRWGFYSLNYGMFADFDLLLRFIWKNRARMRYLPLCTTVMRSGGASTNGWQSTKKINETDRRVIRDNGYYTNKVFLYARYPFKVWGYVFKKGGRL